MLFKFLFFIFLFVVFIGFLLGFSVLRGLKRLFFGTGTSGRQNFQSNDPYQKRQHKVRDERKDEEPHMKISRKLFEAEKGEYVDYEEIKE